MSKGARRVSAKAGDYCEQSERACTKRINMEFYHEPVMLEECIEALNIKSGGIYVDGTAGGGGHSERIAEQLDSGRLICIDRDAEAVDRTTERLKTFECVKCVRGNFRDLQQMLEDNNIPHIDGILLDLGVSSRQLDTAERGFSYMKDAPLDMRMDRTSPISAFDVINGYGEKELSEIFYKYGEEKFTGRIVARIAERRSVKPIQTTLELAKLIEEAIPARAKSRDSHPAKRVFQAVRIEVNGELSGLYEFIESLPGVLNGGGRIAIISFHSLEDRIVKNAFRKLENPCVCPRDLPVCACGRESAGRNVFGKPKAAGAEETTRNPRAKSAKLRVFEKK